MTRLGLLAVAYLDHTSADQSTYPRVLVLVLKDQSGPGFEVLDWLERHINPKHPTVIVVAENLSPPALNRLFRSAVVSAFTPGPIDWPRLARTIAEALSPQSTRPAGGAPPPVHHY